MQQQFVSVLSVDHTFHVNFPPFQYNRIHRDHLIDQLLSLGENAHAFYTVFECEVRLKKKFYKHVTICIVHEMQPICSLHLPAAPANLVNRSHHQLPSTKAFRYWNYTSMPNSARRRRLSLDGKQIFPPGFAICLKNSINYVIFDFFFKSSKTYSWKRAFRMFSLWKTLTPADFWLARLSQICSRKLNL